MSRSRKKKPCGWLCTVRPGEMKRWKREQNRKLRRSSKHIASGSQYRKMNETFCSPADGKVWRDGAWWADQAYKSFMK